MFVSGRLSVPRVPVSDVGEDRDMVGFFANLAQLRTAVVEKQRKGADNERKGAEVKRWAEANLVLIDQITGEAERLLGGAGVADTLAGTGEGASSATKNALSDFHAWCEWVSGGDSESMQYFTPEHDEETGAPVYDHRVVSDKRGNRLRAFAAARVYGRKLKTSSLAHAIFLTGETRAVDAASVKSSLGGLVRYGQDWRREDGGWLEYVGEGLSPNQEMVLQLAGERTKRLQQAD